MTDDLDPEPRAEVSHDPRRLAGVLRWWRWLEAGLAGIGWRRAIELNLPTHSLALATQQILCTGPLLVAFSAVDRHVGGQSVGRTLSRYLALSPAASRDLDALFTDSQAVATNDRMIGLVVALLFATSIAVTQQHWYEQVWSRPRAPLLRSTLRQLVWVAGLCGYLIVVLYAGRAGHGVGQRVHAGRPAGPVAQLVVSFLFFWWSQHLLLTGQVAWRRLVPGAACMAVGMTAMVAASGVVMSGEIVSEVSDYGLVGSTFVLSVWLVMLSGVLFAGALLGQLIADRRTLDGTGVGR
jgi:membrane protein